MKIKFGILALPLLALAGVVGASLLRADELVVNGGFENGVYTSTITSSDTVSNSSVPVGWTANYGFDLGTSYNHVSSSAYDGSYSLSISNYDAQPLATLSQTFADVSGANYTVSFWARDGGYLGDPNAYLSLSIDGTALVTLDDTILNWTEYTYSFTGTGSDTLTIAAQTNPNEWFVDDVSVESEVESVVPEPSSLLLLGSGLAGLAGMVRRRMGARARV